MEGIFLIAFAIILPFYLDAEYAKKFNKATTLKLVLTCLCIGVAIVGLAVFGVSANSILILIALMFACCGDFFLQYINLDCKKFNFGIIAFSVCQILIIIATTVTYGFSWWGLLVGAAMLVGMGFLFDPRKHDLGAQKLTLPIYSVLLSISAGQALFAAITCPSIATVLLCVGAFLFYSSDVLLGLWKYYKSNWVLAFSNWISYFIGIMMIAFSLCV